MTIDREPKETEIGDTEIGKKYLIFIAVMLAGVSAGILVTPFILD